MTTFLHRRRIRTFSVLRIRYAGFPGRASEIGKQFGQR